MTAIVKLNASGQWNWRWRRNPSDRPYVIVTDDPMLSVLLTHPIDDIDTMTSVISIHDDPIGIDSI